MSDETTISPIDTAEMMETIHTFKPPQNGVLKAFFPTVKQSTSRLHMFETDEDKRYVAPFVSPRAAARQRAKKGRKVHALEAAYIKNITPLDPSAALERQAGEAIGGSATPAERRDAQVASILRTDFDAVERRKELMAVDALVKGKNIIEGDDYERQELDYQRDASLGLAANTLTGTNRWNIAGSKPLKFLRAMSRKCVKLANSWTPDIIMDVDAAEAFLDNADNKEKLDLLNYRSGSIDQVAPQTEGLLYMGTVGMFRLWLYTGFFINDANGEEIETLEGGHVIGVGAIEGVQGYGAIQDWDAIAEYPNGLVPEGFYANSWTQKNPSAIMVQTQSAPIVYPRRANASWAAKVNG